MARKKAKALPPKMITVYAEILQETELAILVRCDEDADGVWLPKSQINYEGERGDCGVEIEIPELLADEKGFFDGMGRPEPAAAAEQGQELNCGNCGNLPPEWEARSEDGMLTLVCPECHERALVSLNCEHCGADCPRCRTCAAHAGTCRGLWTVKTTGSPAGTLSGKT